MKIEIEINDAFIAEKVIEGISGNVEFWANKYCKEKIDELEVQVQDMTELPPNEINEVNFEKLVSSLEWQRANQKAWLDLGKQVEKYQTKKKSSRADLMKRAKAALK